MTKLEQLINQYYATEEEGLSLRQHFNDMNVELSDKEYVVELKNLLYWLNNEIN